MCGLFQVDSLEPNALFPDSVVFLMVVASKEVIKGVTKHVTGLFTKIFSVRISGNILLHIFSTVFVTLVLL